MYRISMCVAAIAIATEVASATPLNLVPGRPDVFSSFTTISYSASTHVLTANGFTQNLALNFVNPAINIGGNRAFTLSAIINNNGTISGVGSLSVFGNYGGSNVLLMSASSLSQFGFSNGKLEFVFGGGGAGGSLNPASVQTGVILTDSSMSFSSFTSSFTNSDNGVSDTYLIPSPGVALLGVSGMVSLARRRSR